MKSLLSAQASWRIASSELRRRLRLFAAAFAPVRAPPPAPTPSHVQQIERPIDLLDALNVAGHAAGMHVWDWDIVADTFRFDRQVLTQIDADERGAISPNVLIERGVHPDDQAYFRREFIKALKSEAPLCIDYRIVHRDGSIHPLQLRGQVFAGPDGRATRVVGFTIDMTAQQETAARLAAQVEQQKQAQAKIEQQARQLQQWVEKIHLANETAGVGMWDWNLATGELSADGNMANIFPDTDLGGVASAEDFIGKILHPDDRQSFLATMRAGIARHGADRISTNFRYIKNDGSVQHVELHGRVMRSKKGRAERFLGASWNITAKVNAQIEAQQQVESQRALLERLHLATEVAAIDVWDWDLVNDRITADANMTDAYNGRHFDVQGGRQSILNYVHPEDVAGYFQALDRAIETGKSFFYRFRMVFQDGSQRHVQANARVFRNADGKAVRLLGISQNITEEMKHLQELRRQADEERALRDRLNLATSTAGISIWDKDLVSGDFVCDEQFWKIFGLRPDRRFRVHEGIHSEMRKTALTPLYEAFADPTRDEILAIRHRTSNPRPERQFVQSHMRVFRDSTGKAIRLLGVTWDVTNEELRSEELQRKADQERVILERFNVTTKAAGISAWEFDLKIDNISWLGLTPTIYGFGDIAVADFMKALHGIILDEDRAQLSDPAANAIANNTPDYMYHFRVRGMDGKIHHMRNICHLMRNERGKVRYIMGVTMDVTKEVEVAEQLRKQAESERALVDRLNVATQAAGISPWEFDLVAKRFSWVGTPLSIMHLKDVRPETYLEEVTGRVIPEDRPIIMQAAREAIDRGDDVYSYVYRAVAHGGDIRHLKNFARVMRSPRGTPYRLVGVTWDVTEEVIANAQLQQQAEHERELTERLNIATESAGISSWELDPLEEKFRWIENPLKALAYADDKGRMDVALFASRIVQEDQRIMAEAIAAALQKKSDRIEYRYRGVGNDGQIVHVQNFARLILDAQGRVARVLGVSWDVTQEVLTTTQLQQQAQLERELLERLNVATQGAGISMWEFDLKANRYIWHSKRLSILGLDDVPIDDYFQALQVRIIPEDRHLITDVPTEAVRSGKHTYTFQYRVAGVDGQYYYAQNYVRVLRSPRGTAYRLVGVTWDVTREVTTTAQLAEQAQKERALTDRLSVATQSAGISTWELDLVTAKFLWVENSLAAAAAARAGNPRLDNYAERMHPDDRKLMANEIKAAAKEGRDIIRYFYRIYRPDDSLAYIQTYAKLYFNDQRRAIRALGVSWDITKEVEAAEKLRTAERRLERASLSSSEGHWEAELATGNLWCSSSFHALLGYSAGELDTQIAALERLIHQDDQRTYKDALAAHLSDNARYDVELRLKMSTGEYRWFHMRGAADRTADGTPTVVAGSIHDVHQQKLVEDALNLAQRRFERAINGTQDGLWELDIAGGDSWCSPRLALLLGYPAAQLATNNFLRSLIHPEDEPKLASATIAHYRNNAPFDLEVRLKTRSGEYRWYRARATAERDAAGRALKLSGSLQDVSEARAAHEELVRATEAAEGASRAKSAFLANVSHEIRTPMNGIVGMTGLLLETRLDHTQRDYADTIRSSADSLLTIINDILDFSKIEAGKLDLENIEIDLREIVEDVAAMMAFQATNKGLELIANVHPEVPERVKGDPQRLRQCLVNLVGNAIKFTKTGEIAIDVCAVSRHEGRVLTHFEIRDTGIGIPQSTQQTLFQPFVQADSSTTRHFGGTGLGLSIVRRLVEMMGGQVGVVSELGKGSTFFFTLALEPVDRSVSPADKQVAGQGGRILIVDDNATNRRVLNLQLSHAGYDVTTVGSGAIALTELRGAIDRQQPFEMVITDFQMPDMDGVMLAARILEVPALANTRLVMLTSIDKPGDTQRLAALGFAAYLTKPIRRDELLTCVARAFSGEARQWQMEIRPMITRNSLSQMEVQQRFKGRVLLVEDNIVNQKVATRFLERMGCSVRVADNGADGCAAFQEEPFAVVFMDLQMPVMDGFAATQRIRELENAEPARTRTPIVALTANAMRGDQERCEAAGMDGYLTKPLEVERLRDLLAKLGLAADSAELPSPSLARESQIFNELPPPGNSPPIDLAQLNSIVSGDTEFMRELLSAFLSGGTQQVADIRKAIDALDRPSIARVAHKLRGGCGNIHAKALYTLANELENLAAEGGIEQLHEYGARLALEFERTKQFLNDPSVMPLPVKRVS